jgi:acyl carrier protein
MHIYVLDANGQLCLPGMKGEICVAGAGVGRGYVNDPARTTLVFVDNPVEQGAYRKLYRTGDIGRWTEDGLLEFLGREDTQVKVRGYRIELEEIENNLLAIPGITDAVVKDFKDAEGVAYLVGYICFAQGMNLPENEVKLQLQGLLPAYMVPAQFVYLEKMPLTANGKTDRQSLQAPESTNSGTFESPASWMEEKIADIWQEVLGVEKASVTTSFFDLGGQSLKATQVMARTQKHLGIRLDLATFFQYPTIRKLAEWLQKLHPEKYIPLNVVPAATRYVTTSAQQRMWLLCQQQGQDGAYHLPGAYLVGPGLNVTAFVKAWELLQLRHESLRTTFHFEDGEVWQKINPLPAAIAITSEDTPVPDELTQQYLVEKFAAAPFDLEKGPLVKAALICYEDAHTLLLLNFHHLITDGWSFNIIINDLLLQYQQLLQDDQDILPPLEFQYKDYSSWLRHIETPARMKGLKTFWEGTLNGLTAPPDLHMDRERPATPDYNGDSLPFVINEDLAKHIRSFCRQQQVTGFAFQAAITAALLYDLTGQDDIVMGLPLAGREHPDLANITGLFVNTLPLRIRINRSGSLLQLLQEVNINLLELISHQSYPLDAIVQDMGLSGTEHPLFNVMLVPENTDIALGNKEFGAGTNISLDVTPLTARETISRMDLSIHFYESSNQYHGRFVYRTALFDTETIGVIKEKLVSLMYEFVNEPLQPVGTLKLLQRISKDLQYNIIDDLDF